MNRTCTNFPVVGRLNRFQRIWLLGACLLISAAHGRRAAGATLQELLSGGVITVGNSQFSDWELVSFDATATTPDFAQVTVVPLADDVAHPGLQFAANGQWSVAGINSLDVTFRYRVHALSGSPAFVNHALELTNVDFGGHGGLAVISDEFGGGLGSTLVSVDKSSNFTQTLDASDFAPLSAFSIVTNVFINGLSAADAINLTSFTQRFSQSGPVFAAGDFNENGVVDGADLQRWKAGFGAPNATHDQGDADDDRDVDGADFLRWQRDRGPAAPTRNAVAAVPEPTSGSLAVVAVGALHGVSRRRRSLRPLATK